MANLVLPFWLRVLYVSARERLFGIECACGARTPVPAIGWRYHTSADGEPRWWCRECQLADAEWRQW